MPLPDHDTLQSLLRRLGEFGDAPAVIAFSGAGAETVSFATLTADARRLAGALAARGIGPGAAVAIIGPNSAGWITAFWAIVAAGAVAVPIDAQTGDAEVAHFLAAAGCTLVFTTEARVPRLPHGCAAIALDGALPAASGATALPSVKRGDVAVRLFTSGTTGTPKLVPLTHANLLSNVDALIAARLVGRRDRALLPLPLHHAYPLTVGLMTGLACGAAIILPAGVSGPELIAALKDGRASVLLGVPRLYTALLTSIRTRIATRSRLAQRLFALLLALSARLGPYLGARVGRLLFRALHRQLAPDLRLLVSGGAKLDGDAETTLGALGWEVMTGYGLTETSPILAFNRPGATRPGSAGRPLPGVELRIAKPDASGAGEVEARGASVFAGYGGDAAATARAFTADGWFRTGDFGRIDGDGFLHIVARVAETIVLADGKKLFPETIEAAYAEHRLIKEIALLGVDGALVGLVVPDLDQARETGTARLKNLLRDALAERARNLPSHARLSGFAVARDKLPRTQLGKIRRHLVPALYAAALAERAPAASGEPSAADRELLAQPAAAAGWAFLRARFPGRTLDLEMSPQLDLAIDSLAWIDLTLALERELGARLTEQEIGRIATLRDLLHEIVAAGARPKDAAPPQPVSLPTLGPGLRLAQDAIAALVRLVMRRGFRLRVEGLGNLPPRGPYLICPNHASYLDPFAVAAALPRARIRHTWWGGWTGILYTTRLRRLFSRIAQIVPVDQDRGGAQSVALALAVLERGEALVWFPEGGLTRDGGLQRFLPGVGLLAVRHPVPIVPVAIDGSAAAWPPDQGRPRSRHPIRLRFGRPLDPAPLIADAREGVPQRVADAVRDAVAALLASP